MNKEQAITKAIEKARELLAGARYVDLGDPVGPCRITEQAHYDKGGYPRASVRFDMRTITRPVAQLLLAGTLGYIPEATGHVCLKSRACINPYHLEAISSRLNAIDGVQFGHKSGHAKTVHGKISKYLGVCWHEVSHKWCAQVPYSGQSRSRHLGLYAEEEDAARAILPYFEQSLRAMPGQEQCTRIWQRNYDKVRMQMQQLGITPMPEAAQGVAA